MAGVTDDIPRAAVLFTISFELPHALTFRRGVCRIIDASHVFERFYRVDGARGVTDGGGLGLPIARRIVEQHGGSLLLTVSSEAGSEFVMRLPIERGRAG